jgi:3-hydroxybutyryl-CoA dehydrogenase
MQFQKVGVVGAGNIGSGVVTDLLLHQINAVVVDVSDEKLDRARAEVVKNVRFAPLLVKSAPRLSKEEALERVQFTTRYDDLSSC